MGQLDIFDDGLELTAVDLGDLAPEDGADGAIGIEQALAQRVQRCTAAEDKIVAVFDLSKEQPLLAASLAAFFLGEEGVKARAICGRKSADRGW
jgi:hypothetical protein